MSSNMRQIYHTAFTASCLAVGQYYYISPNVFESGGWLLQLIEVYCQKNIKDYYIEAMEYSPLHKRPGSHNGMHTKPFLSV